MSKPPPSYYTMHTCGESKVNGTFHLDVSSFIVTTSAFVKKENSKMRHLKKFVKPMEVKLRSKMSH